MNSFGTIFKVTTWGESHGQAIGVVIDGCPAGLEISESEINEQLKWRSPGRNRYTSPRREDDRVQILSGVFENKTTGAPISLQIVNQDVDSSKYEANKTLLKPGHANFTYLEKYGIFDHRGGGRASARETACRVAAGAIAKKFLSHYGISLMASIKQIGSIKAEINYEDPQLASKIKEDPLFCPDHIASEKMQSLIEEVKLQGDSLGGIVEFCALGIPVGLGEPIYEKLEAKLAHGMLSIPASKGFEIGSGFQSATMLGSEHNDSFYAEKNEVKTHTNHAGGILGGISTGMPIYGRVPFKPPSSIMKPQQTLTTKGEAATYKVPEGSRHDPCVAIRAVPVVEAMLALVLSDALLSNRGSRL